MAHEEEHTPRCTITSTGGGGGGGGGGLSKKLKHKKVPQRGMGVAQLEKIILEEQHKKDVVTLSPNSVNFRPPQSPSPSSIPLPPPLPPNHRPMNPNFSSTPMHMINGGGAAGGSNWSRSWSGGEYNFVGENPNPNQNQNRGFVAMNLGGLPYESNHAPIWPPLPKQCCSSMMNASSSTSSSVMNYQIVEPPSNQSYCSNNFTPLWQQEEDKMVGMKRSYPFSMENMPIPSFNCKFPYSPAISRLDESTTCSNGRITIPDAPIPVFRESPSRLGAKMDQTNKKLTDENRSLTKDFLTLAPPRPSPQSSKEKLSPLCVGELNLQSHQGQTRDSLGREWSKQQPLHSFFPAAKTPGNSNGEAGEHVDLNLKL